MEIDRLRAIAKSINYNVGATYVNMGGKICSLWWRRRREQVHCSNGGVTKVCT
jgi:hypothetical protein